MHILKKKNIPTIQLWRTYMLFNHHFLSMSFFLIFFLTFDDFFSFLFLFFSSFVSFSSSFFFLILPATRTWRNRFVALSALSTRLRLLQNHPQNLLLDLQICPAKHTDSASGGRLHSDDQVSPQNHQIRKPVVCVKLLLSVFRIPHFSP